MNNFVGERQENPRAKANIFSIFTYTWTFPIFIRGFKRELEEEDLFKPLEAHASTKLGDRLEASWAQEQKLHKHPSLLRALGRVFGLELAIFGFVLVFIELILKMSQPFAIFQLMTFYSDDQNGLDEREVLLYAGIIVAASFTYAVISHWYSLGLQHFGMKIRVACCSLIYRKVLEINQNSVGKTTIGQLVNLLSNDVNRFDQAAVHIHSLWFVPIEISIIIYALYKLLGLTSIVGVGFMILFVPLQVFLGKRTVNLRLKTATETDHRVNLMNDIISGIRVIKMYTWEAQFTKLVEAARRLEMKRICKNSYLKAIILSCNIFTTKFAIFLTILIHILLGYNLTARYVFVVTSFYNILRQAMTRYFPQGVAQVGEASVSIKRIQKFLLTQAESTKVTCNGVKISKGLNCTKQPQKQIKVVLRNISTKVLTNINLEVFPRELVVVTGLVGSGKTTLLNTILKEALPEKGTLEVSGRISYASQEPWIFLGTIRQNILFGADFEEKRYNEVVRVCDLKTDFSVLPQGDMTLVGDRGVTVSGGQRSRISLARAIYRNADIYLLDDPFSAVDSRVSKFIYKECISNFLKSKCTILVTHQLEYLQNASKVVVMKNGKVIANDAQFVKQIRKSKTCEKISDPNYKKVLDKRDPNGKEQKCNGAVSRDVYFSYFNSGGSILISSLIFILFIATQICSSSSDYFIAYWVNLEQLGSEAYQRLFCIHVYSSIIALLIFLTLARSFSFFKFCTNASTTLHNKMFSKLVGTTMGFFNQNPSGRILNRFSKDIGAVDELLPSVLIDCIQIGLSLVGVTVVVNIINPWLSIVTVVTLMLFYLMKVVYLSTSRSVKRLEATTRSPIFAHMSASIQGLSTIKAFNVQNLLQKEFDAYQDIHSSAWYLFLTCSRAFGFWLDMICTTYIAIVTFSLILIKHEFLGGNVGLTITQAISLTGLFQWGMRQWSELENQMTSVERVVEYTNLNQEDVQTESSLHENWPNSGKIEFRSVTLGYPQTTNHALSQLDLQILPKEKIGIVGRTGAGKTSLMNALFQLYPIDGTILIDNLDIKKISKQQLRSKISVISQESFIFSGSFRKNLDPFDEFSDSELWKVLEEVELKNVTAACPEGLNRKVTEGGSNLSVGQRQLLCLARAILRRNKILILDEATANLDPQTDELIQKTIRKKFAECTVLTIAHRLNTIMDSDRVLVIEGGKIVEFDHPYLLLQSSQGVFWSMVEQNGYDMAEALMDIAEKNYLAKTRR